MIFRAKSKIRFLQSTTWDRELSRAYWLLISIPLPNYVAITPV
ncbi:hypothetical protein PROVRUST_06515 [Providencia rustigianii DSM 4541]|uniref:Uncharacterized protein n=1 Tax=Providencia rustigianii DSM 4541 TaxID=500637 RepID=D1P2T8_9GAMM|nr:hypothetical protein PROVRUST_06515 [Providencia rustigianii DSM 4541]